MEDLLQLYEKLSDLMNREKKLIESEEIEALSNNLKEKEKIMKKIESVDVDEYFSELEDGDKKAKYLYRRLEELRSAEAENIEKMQNSRGKIKEKLVNLYSREKSIKGYKKRGKYEAKFFDEKS
ncbi:MULTISPECIES: hypothetical protein [unclassified Halanaerobium]|uniref:hypothetical protein n=1 Tax=unclassified Halanaerobium TaxID=2641197 RepID=UPI000DF178A9|nr:MULTISPECIES: hypothetical protein [unclassified Halanaerobium]RCW47707.1 hypothetical protein DFR78_11250 [Halanaerobium sp. MA284_MarDTE_T2]RCW84649.1 hypothetical protein DER71_11317 [Halanaerobium sp. DL-01]